MPRKSKQINPFDGGLNNYSDARDIEENELAEAVNVDTSNPGRVSIGSSFKQNTPSESLNIFHVNSFEINYWPTIRTCPIWEGIWRALESVSLHP